MPFTEYRACATLGAPGAAPLQMVSPSAHWSMVLGTYSGPMTTGGAPTSSMNWYDGRSDESRHHCALRESAEHDPCLGTVSSRGLNVARRVPDPFDDRFGELDTAAEVAARRVVDRIHVDRSSAGLRAQRVDEGLADTADTGRLAGAAREHHVDIRTRLGGRGRDGCAQQRRRGQDRDTSGCQETSGSV